jgi:hypothetical protein
MQPPAENRSELSGTDPDTTLEVMVIELCTGIPRDEARSIRSDADAALWDRLAGQVAATQRKAQVVICDRDD